MAGAISEQPVRRSRSGSWRCWSRWRWRSNLPTAQARIARAQGDTAKARKAYQDFFALWKDADANLPILIEARKDYDKLK